MRYGPVIETGERPDPVEFFAFECLPCRVKRKPAQQNLIGLSLSEGLHPSTSIDLQAIEISGFVGALMFFDPDFTSLLHTWSFRSNQTDNHQPTGSNLK